MSLSKRILLITPGFPKDDREDSNLPVLQAFVRALRKYQPDLELVVFTLDYPFHKTPYTFEGVPVYPFNGRNKLWRKAFVLVKAYRTFQQLHKVAPFHAIHTFWLSHTSLLGRFISRRYALPFVATAMGQDVLPSNRYGRFFKSAQFTIVYLSQKQKAQSVLQTTFSRIIPWGIEPINKSDSTRSWDLIAVGNLLPAKRFDWFLKVVADIKSRQPAVKALLIGHGPEWESLQMLRKELQLENTLEMLGAQSHAITLQHMQKAKVLVHSSKYESFGMVLIEAINMGCAVVSTSVGIAPELVPTAETTDLLCLKAEEALLRYPESAKKLPVEYEMQEVAKAYAALYNSVN